MQGQNLRASEVGTALESLGKVDRKVAVVVDDLVSAPALGAGIVAVIEKLEPAVTGTLVVDGRRDLLQVDSARPVVATINGALGSIVGPSSDLEGKKRAVLDRLYAGDTLSAADV